MNFRNLAIQAKIANKLKDQNNDEDSIKNESALIIKVIVYCLNLFTHRV